MKRSKTRLLSLLLTLSMMLSMFTGLGVTASAADREPVYVNGTDVSAGGYWKIADSSDDTVGDANDYNYHYDPNTQTLTLNNAIFNKVYAVELGSSEGPYYRYYGIYAYYSDPATSLKLVLNGTNSIQSELLKTPSGPIDNSFGIALLRDYVLSAGAIEVSGTGSLEVCGAYRALFTGDLKAAPDMTVEGSEAIDGSSFELFDPAKTGSEHGAQNPYLAVRIIGPGSTAPAGKRTKTLDCTAFTGDASSDTEAWTWDYDTKTLTLSGVDIAVNEYLDPRNKTTLGVILPADSTVVLNGDNKIVSTAPSTDGASTFGIKAHGNLTIVGDGTLTVEAGGCGQNTGIYADNTDDTELLTIGDGKSAPTVIANAKDAVGDDANSSDGISTPTLVLKKGSLTASGGNARYSSIGVSVLDRILIHDGFTLTASSGTVNSDSDITAAVVGNMESATPGKVVSVANGQAATIEMPGPGDEMMSIPMVKQSGSAPAVITLVDGGSTPAGTRTTALDLVSFSETDTYGATNGGSGTLWTNAAEKWSWDTATKQLTLFGLNLVADSFLPLNLPDGAEIILAAGTENSIRSSSAPIEMGITLIRGAGALTISGSGKLTVGSGTDNPATTFAIAVMNDLTINLTGAGQVTALGAVGNARPDLPTAAIISLMGSIVLGDDVIIAEPAGTSIQTVQGMQLTADQSGSPVTGVVLRTGSAANMIKHLSVHIDELKPGPLSGAKITITGSADMPATSPASFQAENVVWYVVPEDGGKLQKATEFEAGKTYAPGFTFRFDPSTTPFPEADQEHTIRDTSVYVYYKNQLLSFDLAETPYLTPLDQNTMGLELPLVFVASSGDAPTEHTITFDTQGGDPLSGGSTAKTVGGKLAALPTPTQTGKYFAGWYTELLGGQLVTEKTVFTAPATIYARWTIAKIEHTTQPDSNALQGAVAMTDLEVLDKIPLTDAEKNGTDDINIYLNVQDINQTIPTAEKDIITGKAGSDTVASYLDITLFKQVGSSAPAPIPNTNGKITVSLTVPDAFINANAGVTRTYYIIYVHGGAVQTLPASFDAATKRLSFETEQFSTYALAYQDVSGGSSGGNAGGGGAVAATSPVNIPATTRGKVSTNPKTASKGQTVTITVTPEDGYTLDTLTVTDKDGNKLPVTAMGGGKYTFTMPEGAVSIAASFKAASAEGWKLGYQNCPLDEACPLWPYTDVKSSDWYHDGVHFCMENGLMNGYSDGSFKPAANTTRAMIATILYRLEGAPAVSGTAFSDVAAGAYYHDAVLWAQANGVVKGYGDGTFGPDNAVTREQMAAILHRYAQYKGYDVSVGENTNILSYGDAERVEEYAIPAMQWACGAGVVTGKQGASDLNLDPKGSTTRAEMATMMMRFCAELVK